MKKRRKAFFFVGKAGHEAGCIPYFMFHVKHGENKRKREEKGIFFSKYRQEKMNLCGIVEVG